VYIYDGSYDRSSFTDFPAGSGFIIKGNGLLQTVITKSGTFAAVTQDILVNVSGGTQDYCTIFFYMNDDYSAQNFWEQIDWFEINTGAGGTGNLFSEHFTDDVHMENLGSTRDYGYISAGIISGTPPTNDSLTLDLAGASYKGTKTLLCAKQDYKFVHQCSDAEGVTDITYAEIRLDYSGKNVILRVTRNAGDTWTFSEQSDPSNHVTLNVAACTHSTSGTQKTFNYYVTINWAWGDSTETMAIQTYVIDSIGLPDTDNYANVFGVEAHITVSSLVVDDYVVNPSQTLTMTGIWYYDGTVITPPDGDYQIKIYLSAVQKGSTDTTLVSGAFSINDVTAPTILAQYSYTVEAIYMTSAGSFNTVTVDRIKVIDYDATFRKSGSHVYLDVYVTLEYEYNSGVKVTTGTITINTHACSNEGSGVYKYIADCLVDYTTGVDFDTVAGSESTYGLNTVNQNGLELTLTWTVNIFTTYPIIGGTHIIRAAD
jgi:hypothetical protein